MKKSKKIIASIIAAVFMTTLFVGGSAENKQE